MRIRHEVLTWDIPLDASPNAVISFSEFNGNLSTELISISNYDELSNEDIPSLLIRQEKDVDLDLNAALEFAELETTRFLSPDYSTAEEQRPAAWFRSHSQWKFSTKVFSTKYPQWTSDLKRLNREFTQSAMILLDMLRWSSGHLGDVHEDSDSTMMGDFTDRGWALFDVGRKGWTIYAWDSQPVQLNTLTHKRLRNLIRNDQKEPLARGILREAAQHRISSPRVALIMAVVAAEAAVKGFIAERVPGWSQPLVVEAQQIPLSKFLNGIIPAYVDSEFTFVSPFLPKAPIVKPILKAVESRNVAIHQPPDSPKSQVLTDELNYAAVVGLLTAVSDLLYFLDFFSGADWAIEMISRESREDWIGRNPPT